MYQVYNWQAVKDFYASVLHKLEQGSLDWGSLDLPALEMAIMSRASLSYVGTSKQPSYPSNTQQSGQSQQVYFCAGYQKGKCWKDGPHTDLVKGKEVQVQHICAKCWLNGKKLKNHQENSNDCPLRA